MTSMGKAVVFVASICTNGLSFPLAALAAEFEVQVSGDNSTADPIGEALAAARRHRVDSPDDTIIIKLPAGTFRRGKVLELNSYDSGRPGAPLIIRGAMEGTSVSGAVSLSGHQIAESAENSSVNKTLGVEPLLVTAVDMQAQQPIEIVRRGAYLGDVASRVELFQGDYRFHLARWPGRGYTDDVKAISHGADGKSLLLVPPEKLQNWQHEKSLWVGGYFASDWAYETAPAAVDFQLSALVLSGIVTPLPLKAKFRYFVFNALSEMKEYGDYVVNSANQTVALVPYPLKAPVEAAVMKEVLQINNAEEIVIENLAFEKTLGTTVTIANSRHIQLAGCFVGHSGGDGIHVINGFGVHIDRCIVADTAERGILLVGGDRKQLVRAEHVVRNSTIVDFGIESKSYRPGIEIRGVGISVEGCVVMRAPHSAVMLSGNENIIENSEFLSVLEETDDAGVIYMGRDWTQRGNVIRGNYFHDIGGENRRAKTLSSVYLDDQISGDEILDNVFVGGTYAIYIGGGRDNIIRHNAFVAPTKAAIWIDNRGQTWERALIEKEGILSTRLREIDVRAEPWLSRYPPLSVILDDEPGAPKNNRLVNNVSFNARLVKFQNEATRRYTIYSGSLELFVDGMDSILRKSGGLAELFDKHSSMFVVARRRNALKDLNFAGRLKCIGNPSSTAFVADCQDYEEPGDD